MKIFKSSFVLMSSLLAASGPMAADQEKVFLPEETTALAERAVTEYGDKQIELLEELVAFKTYHRKDIAWSDNPEFSKLKQFLRMTADRLGFDYTDHGALLVIGLGHSAKRVGIVTHADVKQADPKNWENSPFELDRPSEPGKLIARGTEDNKAPIATALYAMKTLQDSGIAFDKRLELIISLTEEHDWAPFKEVLEQWEPPQINVAIDSEYPVVVAEKGRGSIYVRLSSDSSEQDNSLPKITHFSGGMFNSQVAGNAKLLIENANRALFKSLKHRIKYLPNDVKVKAHFDNSAKSIELELKGRSVHSMHPWLGTNALVHLANLVETFDFAPTAEHAAISFINELVGTNVFAEKFGELAFNHPFMGPLTLSVSTADKRKSSLEIGLNLRTPDGKSLSQLDNEIRTAVAEWAQHKPMTAAEVRTELNPAYFPALPPHVETLLRVYKHFTGRTNAEPVSLAGGTNAKLLPNGINFGPSMPGMPYTGHSSHEFITEQQMMLNLRMYTAAFVQLLHE